MFSRRRYERYRLRGSAFVIFEHPRRFNIGKPRIEKLGPLSDISQEGLSVEYIPERKRFEDASELSIFVPGQGIAIYRIPFRNISDIVVAELDEKRTIMRRGIQFDELNHHHTSKLKRFVNSYTRDEVPDRRNGLDRRNNNRSGESFAFIPDRRGDQKKDRRKAVAI